MRVDGTHGLGPHGLPEPTGPLPKGARGGGQAGSGDAPDTVEVRSSQNRYVRLAAEAEEVNLRTVAEARELIRAGKLDTPEAIRRAAEAILRFGP
ncbi:MAG TPA: hypothetical protein VNA25_26725 [Phycisphaerae bacterium]|nr:hypothetical protein [Phycisphaerae bacterium]